MNTADLRHLKRRYKRAVVNLARVRRQDRGDQEIARAVRQVESIEREIRGVGKPGAKAAPAVETIIDPRF